MLCDESSFHAASSEPRLSVALFKQKLSLVIDVAMIRFHKCKSFAILLRAAADVMWQCNCDWLTERKLCRFNTYPDEWRHWLHVTTRHVKWSQESNTKLDIDRIQVTGNGSLRNSYRHVVRLRVKDSTWVTTRDDLERIDKMDAR